jgi:hypothetical protein
VLEDKTREGHCLRLVQRVIPANLACQPPYISDGASCGDDAYISDGASCGGKRALGCFSCAAASDPKST